MKKLFCALLLFAMCIPVHAAGSQWRTATILGCENWVSLRSAPDTAAHCRIEIPLGAKVETSHEEGNFTLCRYDGREGYILTGYLYYGGELSPHANTGALLPNVEGTLSLYSQPSYAAYQVAYPKPGMRLNVLDWKDKFVLVQVEETGKTGYVFTGDTMAADIPLPTWPYDYDAMLAAATELARRGAEYEVLAVSPDGRDIPVLRYGTGDIHILLHAGIHAREQMTSPLALDLLASFMQDHPNGREGVTVHVAPMVNPDGNSIAIYGKDGIRDAALAEEVDDMLFVPAADWKANARGVDLNRNFPYGWDALYDTGTPMFQRYRGPSALSEIESAALAEYTQRYDFSATVSLHSYGSLIYCYGGENSEDDRLARELALRISDHTGYHIEPEGPDLEKGGYKDWALAELGIPSVTIEIGARKGGLGDPAEYTSILVRHMGLFDTIANWAMEHAQ